MKPGIGNQRAHNSDRESTTAVVGDIQLGGGGGAVRGRF